MSTIERRRYLDGFWLGLGIGVAIGSLIAQITAARSQTVWSTTTGTEVTSICAADGETWHEIGTICHSNKGQRILPRSGASITGSGSFVTSYTPKCPDDYTLVYTGRAMCARDLREPE